MKEKILGLQHDEVEARIKQGLVNTTQSTITKTKKQIYKENICTLFNGLNVVIATTLAFVGAWSNILFIAIIIVNVLIGIIQELHAKKLVDELSLLMIPSVQVMRHGEQQQIHVDDIVMDDIMMLESGKQIVCDAHVIQGVVEVNESLLTGESDPIHKESGDVLLSGSSVISGKCYAQVIHIGNENYASHVANEVKQVRAVQSELLNSMRKITKMTCILIVPLGIILFYEAFFLRDTSLQSSIISSSAGLLGMLPKGLVLLISVSLVSGVRKLAKRKILIQDLYSLETLAHVDTLCLDKTGTITNGQLRIEQVITLHEKDHLDDYISAYLYHSKDNNATYDALCECFGKKDIAQPIGEVPFSSIRKWSSTTFNGFGSLIIGAPDKLLQEIPEQLLGFIREGKRVLLIGHCIQPLQVDSSLEQITPLLAIVLTDTMRVKVKETLAYFKQEGIDIKIISGDHVDTVSAIAKTAGLMTYDACIDMSHVGETLTDVEMVVDQYSVFGRVTPLQKKLLVQALQKHGHCVAMTGDGVNDMLALKEADCSIAIAEGSDAVKQMSQVVLLNSEFSYLPDVLLQGRRVVNNVTRVASVFFIKTIYSIALSLLCALINFPFPFIPIQITLIDGAIEAYPAFLTMLESNIRPIQGTFLNTVFRKAMPNAIAILVCIITLQITNELLDRETLSTMMYLCVSVISMNAVIHSCLPMNRWRLFVCTSMIAGFLLAIVLFSGMLHIVPLSMSLFTKTCVLALIGVLISHFIRILFNVSKQNKNQDYAKQA